MESSKVLRLVLFIGVALATSNAKVAPVGQAIGTIDGCVINCFPGGYFQHPRDCSKFIQCAPFGPVVMECPKGTIWDDKHWTCNHLEFTTCDTGKYLTPDGKPCTEEPTEQPPTKAPTTQPPTAAPTTQPPTAAPTTQPPTAAPTTQPPTAAPTTQPPTAEPTTQPPTAAPTTQPPTAAPTTQPPTAAPTTQPPTAAATTEEPTQKPTEAEPTTTDRIVTTTPGECHFECPKSFGIFSHPRDCNSFFVCQFGKPVEKNCPRNLYFNDKTNMCVLPLFSGCKNSLEAAC